MEKLRVTNSSDWCSVVPLTEPRKKTEQKIWGKFSFGHVV